MTTSLYALVIALIFLVVLAAFFSAAEIGMMSINRYRLRYLVKNNHKQAQRVSRLIAHPDKLLGLVLIGSTVSNIVASMVSTLIGHQLYGDLGVAIGTGLLTLVILVFAEMTPKTLAALYTERVAFACALPLQLLQTVFSPLVSLIGWMANTILRCLGFSATGHAKEVLSSDELRSMVHEAGSLLPLEHKSMLISLLDLERARVEDIMIPKAEITGIDLDLPWQTVLELLETAQHTRLPVYRGHLDQLLGIVHLRRLLNVTLESVLDETTLLQAVEPPYYIPEATPLNVQILNFRKMKRRSGFVVNEYGDIQGLVTMEDILEEVVGEFTTDIATLSQDIFPERDGSVIVNGSITLRQLNRALGWHLPAVGPRTLSGLIIEHLGYIPPAECCLTIEAYHIEILKVGANRVKSVRMTHVPLKRRVANEAH